MRLATLRNEYGDEFLCYDHQNHFLPVQEVGAVFGTFFPNELWSLLQDQEEFEDMKLWYQEEADHRLPRLPEASIHHDHAKVGPLYRHPRKIWGIGLNYQDHASDLDETSPSSEPASFMRPDTTIIGHGETIQLPPTDISERITGEAELAIIIGKECRNVDKADWLSVVAGFTTVLDMTAEDIQRRNPRNLTQSKSFDTFFSFGPTLVTPDEIEDVFSLKVQTVLNDQVMAENTVNHMMFPPDELIAYHSRIMTLLPGDIISTGTPGATVLSDGDQLECRIDGFPSLKNSVAAHPQTEN